MIRSPEPRLLAPPADGTIRETELTDEFPKPFDPAPECVVRDLSGSGLGWKTGEARADREP